MGKSSKIVAFAAVFVLSVVMAVATFVEKYKGTDFVSTAIYGSWWFATLWAVLAVAGLAWFFKVRRQLHNIALHCSLVLILIGALLTSLTSRHGSVHLRQGIATDSVTLESGMREKMPFSIILDKFAVDYHPGTMAASDYRSEFTIADGSERIAGSVAMNSTFNYSGVRLFQTSYDNDLMGSRLTYNEDRYGQPVTYAGYALLFLSMLWMLIAPDGGFRRLLRDTRLRKGLAVAVLLGGAVFPSSAVQTMSKPAADAFGTMLIERNGRICPLQTVAIDFTKKLSGKTSFDGYTAEQVFAGFLFYGNDWRNAPIIKVKSVDLRKQLGLKKYASVDDFFSRGYILGPYVEAYYQGEKNAINKAAVELDDKIAMIVSLRQGEWLKMFPVEDSGKVGWYSPVEQLPASTDSIQALFIHRAFGLMNEEGIQTNDDKALIEIIGQMKKYQVKYGGSSIPSEAKLKAERLYNAVPFTDWLYRIDITAGILLLLMLIRSMLGDSQRGKRSKMWIAGVVVLALSFLALTYGMALRSVVSGRLPLGNGYETMLAIAWCVQAVALLLLRRMPYLLSFGLLLSGFFLLVSAIGQMDPQITPLMPVLSSPLLSIHVSLIMIAYALLSFTFLCAIIALVLLAIKKTDRVKQQVVTLQLVSRMFLYPALALLAMGIFIGAVWANQSWGRYWGWDPKETWALINFMLYAVAIHSSSLPWLRRPVAYHVYVGAVFLTVLMTYIGVNYFLGGMHSYA